MNVVWKALRALPRVPIVGYRAIRWRTAHWLPHHLMHHRPFGIEHLPKGKAVDVMVLIADHFEPIRAIKQPGDQEAGRAAEITHQFMLLLVPCRK